VWKKLGPWKAHSKPETPMDAGLGLEGDMLLRYQQKNLKQERCILSIPVAAEIITDAGGFASKVRDGKRFGKYFPPLLDQFYYQLINAENEKQLSKIKPLPSFEDIVLPLGFKLPINKNGNLIKGNPSEKTIISSIN